MQRATVAPSATAAPTSTPAPTATPTPSPTPTPAPPPVYTFEIVNTYPHDPNAFTQGSVSYTHLDVYKRQAEGWGELAEGAYAIINLAGENIGSEGLIPLPGTWSKERKQRIMHSRRDAGQAVVAAVEAAREKPRVVVQMSGIDYYPSGNVVMTEESQRGRQFLADVVADYWEPSTAPVEALGVRRVITRMAPLLHRETGPLPPSLLQFKLFAGGRLGSGRQWLSWIHLQDTVRALRFLAEHETATGVFNLAAPNPVTNTDFTKILGQVMQRPTLIPVPEFALKLLLGEVSALVLSLIHI